MLLFLLFSAAHAETVFIAEPTGSGFRAAELETVRDLVKAEAAPLATVSPNESDADSALETKISRLGESILVIVSRTREGKTLGSSQKKIARLDDIDTVIGPLVRTVLGGGSPRSQTKVSELSEKDERADLRRRQSRTFWRAAFGPGWQANAGSAKTGVAAHLGFGWDAVVGLLEGKADLAVNSSAFSIVPGLRAGYFFSETDLAPYASADFGYGFAKSHSGGGLFNGSSGWGFAVGLGAGVLLFRTSSVNLDVGVRGSALFRDLGAGTPLALAVTAGLLF